MKVDRVFANHYLSSTASVFLSFALFLLPVNSYLEKDWFWEFQKMLQPKDVEFINFQISILL